MKQKTIIIAAAGALCHVATAASVTFEDVSVPPAGFQNDFGGQFQIGNATFLNNYDADLDTWSGFAISNSSDNSPGGLNREYSAITGGGFGGSANYAVGLFSTNEFELSTQITFDSLTSMAGRGTYVTNTTWAYYDMLLEGGDFGSRKFGGATGDDPDWFKLVVEGFGETNNSTGSVEFYLADFRYEDDYIADDWRFVNLSSLGSVARLKFSLSSSDPGMPLYFAMDDFMAVPEPSSLLTLCGGLGLLMRRKR